MAPRLGLVGRGYWGDTYAKVLKQLRIPFWQEGRYWHMRSDMDGLIVACSTQAHYEVAKCALGRGIPVLIEKPITLCSKQAKELVELGGIGFAGHTRLYAPGWAEFKERVGKPQAIEAWGGGVNETNPCPIWNWATHLGAMCLDLGFDPRGAQLHITAEKQPVRMVADGLEFADGPPGALANLVSAFCDAIEKGEPDNRGLRLGYEVVKFTEELIVPS